MLKIKRWFRQVLAKIVVKNHEQWGGMLYDYANERWVLLGTWSGYEDDACLDIIDNMLNSDKSAIYVSCVKVGVRDGYFVVVDSDNRIYYRAFFHGIYDSKEAMADVSQRCREIADKMGFRRPENTEGVQS